jgi:hypothetical protein
MVTALVPVETKYLPVNEVQAGARYWLEIKDIYGSKWHRAIGKMTEDRLVVSCDNGRVATAKQARFLSRVIDHEEGVALLEVRDQLNSTTL